MGRNFDGKNANTVLPLWPDGAPGSEGWEQVEEETQLPNGLAVVRNVVQPSLTVFLPDPAAANGTGVIVCPGGAYHFLAHDHEGIRVARWLNERGAAAFMLKYRLIRTGEDFPECVGRRMADRAEMQRLLDPLLPLILADGLQAVRMVRARAEEWGIRPGRVGITGFSAGGMLTAMVARQYDASSRPDFAAPIYAAPPPPAPLPADAPPLFLACAADDEMAVGSSLGMFAEWRTAGRPVELHIYASGGHGFGMNPQGLPADGWIERLWEWAGGLKT